jgi:hypothetical protein
MLILCVTNKLIIQNVIMLNFTNKSIMLSVIMLNTIMLYTIMLNVIMLNVIMLNAEVPIILPDKLQAKPLRANQH